MEFFVEDFQNLPNVVTKRLSELRELDEISRGRMKELTVDEHNFFEEISNVAKENPDFDEEPLHQRLQQLLGKRNETLQVLDEQMKKIQKLYDLVDGRIAFLDQCTKDVPSLFSGAAAGYVSVQLRKLTGMEVRKKKKRKAEELVVSNAMSDAPVIPAVDPNEPIYCTCRQVSYGNMIACEHPDCPIEWFHFGCVGLTEEPNEPWYCPNCRKAN